MRWRKRCVTLSADEVPIGVRANGAPLRVPLTRVSTLIAGLPGAGKSSTLGAVIVGCAPMAGLSIVVLDPKRVQFTHTVSRCVVARGLVACGAALDDLVALMEYRYEVLEGRGLDEWPASWGRVLVLVDELAELMASGDRKADVARSVALRRVLQLGRAAGLTVVAATQRPSASLIDSDARALFGARIAHALDGPESVRMAGLDPDIAPAHRLPLGASHAGLCYVATDGTRQPVHGRVWSTDRELVRRVCDRHAALFVDPFPRAVLTVEPVLRREGAERPAEAHAESGTPREGMTPAPNVELSPDEAAVAEALRSGPIKGSELPSAAGLPEGRCRRARDRLVSLGCVRQTAAGWALA